MALAAGETNLEAVAEQLAVRLGQQLPKLILELLQSGADISGEALQLECSIAAFGGDHTAPLRRLRVASLELDHDLTPSASHSPIVESTTGSPLRLPDESAAAGEAPDRALFNASKGLPNLSENSQLRPNKRQKLSPSTEVAPARNTMQKESQTTVQRKKRFSDNPALQPSTLDKYISGVWESIYSGVKLDPTEVMEQWQAIESSGQPRLLTDATGELAVPQATEVQGAFGRMNVLTRKISQTSRTCRSLEVIVQAQWVQAFEDRVLELTESMPREKAKKTTIAEACMDFSWSEKELRNKMGIWKGYHDIKSAGGWAALVFAGTGLYRFCKYRVSFTEETFDTLRKLRHRFDVGADCLHPRWRQLLGIIGQRTERKYTGHPHDWVVGGSSSEAIALPETYRQWYPDFQYTHLDECVIDEDAWGSFEPRREAALDSLQARICQVCNEQQSNEPRENHCACFPSLFGSTKASFVPVQVFRTPNGKNNGLIACCPFEAGAAIGEFAGLVTRGLANLDVMVGQTNEAVYQIWQGKMGNHTRFVNHSCRPNSEYQRFVWLGTQRIVLVSKGVEAGEEITVDYSDVYWKDLDKVCLCGSEDCRYRERQRRLLTPPDSS